MKLSHILRPALVVTLVLAAGSAWAVDEIQLIAGSSIKAPGGRLRGQIQSESPTEVQIQVGGATQTVPIDQIVSIRYDGQPPSLSLAESREASDNLVDAAEQYQKAAAEASEKPLVAQKAQMGRARVLAELGLSDPTLLKEAVRELTKFTTANPKSRFSLAALDLLARLQLHQGDLGAATKTAGELAKRPGGGDRAAILQARIKIKQEKYDEALASLETVIATAAKGSILRRDAMLAKAEALAHQKKYQDAETAVREVMKGASPEDSRTQALAYNTLGDCLLAAGKTSDAMYAYLHTDLVFFKNKEEHPRALAQLVKIFRETKREDRAQDCLDRLKQDYPQSPWVAVAQGPENN